MRKQDYPPYYQMLIKLGLGIIGGIVHIFCLPVLANSDSVDSSLYSVEPINLTITGLSEQLADSPELSAAVTSERDVFDRNEVDYRRFRTGAIAKPEPTFSNAVSWQSELADSLEQMPRAVAVQASRRFSEPQKELLKAGWEIEPLLADSECERPDSEPFNSELLNLDQLEISAAIEQGLEIEPTAIEETDATAAKSAVDTQTADLAIATSTDGTAADLFAPPAAAATDMQIRPATHLSATPNEPDLLSEILGQAGAETETLPVLDEELGTLRLIQLRSRENEDLGILRILRTAAAVPPPPPIPVAFLTGRLGFVNVDNVFRSDIRIDEQVYQAGVGLYLAPRISENTSLYGVIETNIARYNDFSAINYNEVQLQVGLRQRLSPRTYAQIGWRNQRLYSPGYREKLFGAQYIDTLISHRSVLTPKTWLDSFYQVRLGFADPESASRFRQTFTLSLNYGISRDFRTSLLYQLDFDDYTQIARYDTYQQVLGVVSYNITPESRISVFGGTRFGRSSSPDINLDDTFYGAGLNVNVSLF
ncbi:MAG: hypothetical protein WBG63_05625 [Phormidesmis sp.]